VPAWGEKVATCIACRSVRTSDNTCSCLQAPDDAPLKLGVGDYRTLIDVLLHDYRMPSRVRAMLERKAAAARAVFARDVPPGTVRINSIVSYRIDSGPLRTGVLSQGRPRAHCAVPLETYVGAALIGLREGEAVSVETPEGSRRVAVDRVLFTPPAHVEDGFARAYAVLGSEISEFPAASAGESHHCRPVRGSQRQPRLEAGPPSGRHPL